MLAVQSEAGVAHLDHERVHQRLERGELRTRRRWRFKAKGTPKELKVYTVKAPVGQ